MTPEKTIILREKKVLTYSALAAAFLAGDRATAEVLYTDENPDVTFSGETGGDIFDIDFDGDGTPEFGIYHKLLGPNTTGPGKALIVPYGSSGYIINTTTPYGPTAPIAQALGVGNYISNFPDSPTVGTWNPGSKTIKYLGSSTSLQFPGAGDRYIGIAIIVNYPDIIYGWILVNIDAITNHVVIKEYALETTENMGILAGSETSLPVTLSEFKAVQDDKSVVLNWTTDSEVENLGFILERRTVSNPEALEGSDISRTSMSTWEQIAHFESDPELAGQGSTTEQTSYQFIDDDVEYGKSYNYRLTDVSYSVVNKGGSKVIAGVQVVEQQPESFGLHQSYPNPFNPETNIGYTLEKTGAVELSIYNLKGQLIESLVNDVKPAGEHNLQWNASDVEAGVYFVELVSGDQRQMQKITLLK